MLDPEGTILTWNSGAEAIKGYAASEVLGRNFRMFFTAQDILEGKPQAELNVARTRGRAESAGWRVRKDGSVFWANAVLTPVHDGEGRLRGFAKVTRDLSAQRRLARGGAGRAADAGVHRHAGARAAQPAGADPQRDLADAGEQA